MARTVPDTGDVVWLELDPQAGHEQAGHRPALVLSPSAYNTKTSLLVCCPISSQAKGYPFEVPITNNPKISGVILADQVKSLDWQARKAKIKGRVSDYELAATLGKLKALIGI